MNVAVREDGRFRTEAVSLDPTENIKNGGM